MCSRRTNGARRTIRGWRQSRTAQTTSSMRFPHAPKPGACASRPEPGSFDCFSSWRSGRWARRGSEIRRRKSRPPCRSDRPASPTARGVSKLYLSNSDVGQRRDISRLQAVARIVAESRGGTPHGRRRIAPSRTMRPPVLIIRGRAQQRRVSGCGHLPDTGLNFDVRATLIMGRASRAAAPDCGRGA